MWEACDLKNEDFLWAGIPFLGGIAGQQQAPCGVVSSSAVFLGLRHRCSLQYKEQAKLARTKTRAFAQELVKDFEKEFGTITCRDMIGFNTSDPEENKKFRESNLGREKCYKAMEFAIDKLYEFEDRG
jgi:C_GCAxxG_C_C family probable redox protein